MEEEIYSVSNLSNSEVVVIGGGLIGASITYYLSKKNVSVTLLERGGLASATSGASSGRVWLATKKPGLHLKLAQLSLEMLKELMKEMRREVECDGDGEMVFFETEQESQFMENFVKEQRDAGIDIKILTESEIRKIQPSLAIDKILGATYSPLGISINPMDLVFALTEEAKRKGAEIRRNTDVEGIRVTSSQIKSVMTNQGEIKTKFVVNAAGVRAPEIGKMVGLEIPIVPMRGQILVTEAVAPTIRIPVIEGRYLVMKRNPELLQQTNEVGLEVTCNISQSPMGNIHIGASKESVGYSVNCSPNVMAQLARNAIKFFPDLSSLHVIRSYAGLRPRTSDGLPIIGKVQEIGGFIIAAGHGGDGVTLAPITGKLVSEIITSGEPSICIDELALPRFN